MAFTKIQHTLTKTDENRHLWGGARWQAHPVGDE